MHACIFMNILDLLGVNMYFGCLIVCLFLNLHVWVFCLQCLHTTCMPRAHGNQKRGASDPQTSSYRQLWAVMWGLGIEPRPFWKKPGLFLTNEPSLQPLLGASICLALSVELYMNLPKLFPGGNLGNRWSSEKLRHEVDNTLAQTPALLSRGADTRLSVKPKFSLLRPLGPTYEPWEPILETWLLN